MIGIYKITNPNNKCYIGSSFDIDKRWNDYKKLKCKEQKRIYQSLLKYGVLNHKFEVVEIFESITDPELRIIEQNYIKLYEGYSKGLNSSEKGVGLPKGTKLIFKDKESRNKKISENNLGKPKHSQEYKDYISKRLLGNTHKKGKIVSDETRDKISKGKIGHVMFTDEWAAKISKALKGKPLSEEHKQNLRKPKQTLESKAKIGIGNKGKRDIIVEQCDLNGMVIKEWSSGKQAAIELNIQGSNINNACHGRMKTYKGFIWRQKLGL